MPSNIDTFALNITHAKELTRSMGTLVCLDMPPGIEFGIDFSTWHIGEKFQGIKMIPQGGHIVHTTNSMVGTSGSLMSNALPRSSKWFYILSDEIIILHWNKENEELENYPDLAQADRIRAAVRQMQFDTGLAPYPKKTYDNWLHLSSHITKNILSSILEQDHFLQSSRIEVISSFSTFSSPPLSLNQTNTTTNQLDIDNDSDINKVENINNPRSIITDDTNDTNGTNDTGVENIDSTHDTDNTDNIPSSLLDKKRRELHTDRRRKLEKDLNIPKTLHFTNIIEEYIPLNANPSEITALTFDKTIYLEKYLQAGSRKYSTSGVKDINYSIPNVYLYYPTDGIQAIDRENSNSMVAIRGDIHLNQITGDILLHSKVSNHIELAQLPSTSLYWVVSELQVAFASFLIGEKYDGFRHWCDLLMILLQSDECFTEKITLDIIPDQNKDKMDTMSSSTLESIQNEFQNLQITLKRSNLLDRLVLYCHVLNTLTYQITNIPQDFFLDELSKDNFLIALLSGFRSILIRSSGEETERLENLRWKMQEDKYQIHPDQQKQTQTQTQPQQQPQQRQQQSQQYTLQEIEKMETVWNHLHRYWSTFVLTLEDTFDFKWVDDDIIDHEFSLDDYY